MAITYLSTISYFSTDHIVFIDNFVEDFPTKHFTLLHHAEAVTGGVYKKGVLKNFAKVT